MRYTKTSGRSPISRRTAWGGVSVAVLALSCPVFAEAQSVTDIYKRLVAHQSPADPLIGVWYGSQCGKRIVLAIVLNEQPTPDNREYKLKKLLLNGKEAGRGYHDGDVVGYLSPLAPQGAYQGVTAYRARSGQRWFPQRAFVVESNLLKTVDDVGMARTCGASDNVFLRSETPVESGTRHDEQTVIATGSGFLLWRTALVMTAQHVVENATVIRVLFPSREAYRARVISVDADNDLAILELQDFTPGDRGFSVDPVTPVRPGQIVSTLGYPTPSLLGVRPSIVSAHINADVGLEGRPTQFRTTLPFNPGNSGGPILAEDGRVVGVALSFLKGSEAIHFAAKMTVAVPLLQHVGWTFGTIDVSQTLGPSELFAKFGQDVPLITVESAPKR